MTQETELKPCPFCGGEAIAWSWSPHENTHYIGCKDDCIPSFEGVYHEDELICQKLWNTRPEGQTKVNLIEALEGVYKYCLTTDVHEIYDGTSFDFNDGYSAALEDLMNSDFFREALEKAKGGE